jgi:uncharacterized membrane protein
MSASSKWDDRKIERTLGHLLRFGVTAAAFLVLSGGILHLVHNGNRVPEYHVFRGVPGCAPRLAEILSDALKFQSQCVMMTGLLLLIATPVLRVFISALMFLRIRDRLYFINTLIVLGFLLFSLFFSGA